MVEEQQKKEKKKRNQVPFRLNVLFIFVFLLFSVLILRLGYVQIVNGETYQDKVEATESKSAKLNSARGKIYDAGGQILVGNKPGTAITYTTTKEMASDSKGMVELAEKLAEYIDKDTDKVTERDEKDYWISKHGITKAYNMKLTDAEQVKYKDDEDNTAYQLLLKRITDADLKQFSKKDMEAIAIWRELKQSMVLTPHYVKTGLTKDETARVGEHLGDLPGINISTVSDRTYPNGHPFYLGHVKPIPKEKLDYYLTRDYDRNDLVGIGNLEQYYEDVLSGTGTKLTYVTDQKGNPEGNPTRIDGRRGNDIVLTLNTKFQHKVGKILEDGIRTAMVNPKNPYLDSAYAVVMNPNTGEILSLSGKKYNKNGKFDDVSYETVQSGFLIGSNIKGATVLAGLQTGNTPGYFNDKPMRFPRDKGGFESFPGNHIGTVNEVTALEASSNVYMGKTAANMAGIQFRDAGSTYQATHVPPPNSEKVVHAFKSLRNLYSEFGLGVKTGIDLPSESIGYPGPIPAPSTGLILRYAIGQYDSYTPIQIAQYFSTIANGGYRMQPHLLKEIREPTVEKGAVGKVVYQHHPKVLNHITMSHKDLDKVHQGFWLVTHGSRSDYEHTPTAYQLGGGSKYAKYQIAGKTGTADIDVDNDGEEDTVNELFSGYAPAGPKMDSNQKPQVVVVVIVPGDDDGHDHIKIAGKIFKAYFKTYGKNH